MPSVDDLVYRTCHPERKLHRAEDDYKDAMTIRNNIADKLAAYRHALQREEAVGRSSARAGTRTLNPKFTHDIDLSLSYPKVMI